MATPRNKRKLAAVATENQEEHFRNTQSWNTAVPRGNEDYITQMSEKIEDRVTRKLSQDFSQTECQILIVQSKLDAFLLNPQERVHSGAVPGTSRSSNTKNHEPNEDRSQIGPPPEVGTSMYRLPQSMNSDPDEASYSYHILMFPFTRVEIRAVSGKISAVSTLFSAENLMFQG